MCIEGLTPFFSGRYTHDVSYQGEDPVSLIHAIAAALMVAVKSQADVRVALGYLALLCVWCYDSPKGIKDFLSESVHLQFVSSRDFHDDSAFFASMEQSPVGLVLIGGCTCLCVFWCDENS